MAEGILSPIAQRIIENLGSAAVEEFKSLWNVETELEDLEETIKTVKAVLVDAEKRQIRDEQVRVWLQRLEDAVYLADDLVDEISTQGLQRQLMMPEGGNLLKKARNFFSDSNPVLYRHEVAREIKDVKSKLDKIAADRERFHFVENMREEETNAARRSAGRETRSFVWREDVIGRDDDKREILKLLLETNTHGEKVSVIPIVGMGGLGKTTLAQLVFNDESVQSHFDQKIWVCVSDIFDERFIIEKILQIVSPDVSTKGLGLERLQNTLLEKLAGKRYLLVLDDVWNENLQKWKNLRGLLMSFADGSKIIVTTRSRNVADVMRTCIQRYDLGILNPENSWSLFKKLAFEQGQEHINSATEEVGKKIVEKCGGVPLAISMIGSMLRYKNPATDWPFFLRNELSNISQEDNGILPTLKLSYDCLPSHLKHCFAYCRLFPKDYEIDVQTLVQLWIAQGFIKSSNPSQSLEEIGYRCFMELFSISFFQEYVREEIFKVEICKMHDLVHDLAIKVGGGKYAMLKLGERSIDKRVRHVSFEFHLSSVDEIPSSLLQAERLRSILLRRHSILLHNQKRHEREQGESICDRIVSNFKFLRMLDLHGLGIKKLPNSIGELKHLRYLDLSNNEYMEALPTCITELVNLQTLKLNGCKELHELPRDINKLVNLQTLKLNGCKELHELPRDINKLINLQRLELNYCDMLRELPRDINKLVNLRHLEFNNWNIRQMSRGLGQLTNLQTLSYFALSSEGTNLESRGSELDELAGLNNLSGELEIRGLRGGLETKGANLKKKQNLRSLSLNWGDWYGGYENDSNVDIDEKHEMTIEGLHPHPNLRELTLRYYEGVTLSSWLPELTNLVNLQLIRCDKCQHLPPLSHLPSLKKMILFRLPCLEYITNDDADVGGTNVGGTNFWTSLQQLYMGDLPKLKGWWRLPDDVAENQLKLPSFPPCFSILGILDCQKLSCMPLYPSVEDLDLTITSWKTFEGTALKAEEEASSSSSSSSSSIKREALSSLRNLTFRCLPDLVTLPEGLQRATTLRSLEILDCDKCRHLPPLSHLPSLKKMTLLKLDCLEYITNDDADVGGTNFWISLQELELRDLPKLKGWWRLPDDVAENQVKLPSFPPCFSKLIIENCPELSCMPLYPSVETLTLINTSWKIFEETAALKAEEEASSSSSSSSIKREALSSLRDLKFESLPNLVTLPEGLQRATTLQTLNITGCHKCRHLQPLSRLPSLKIMTLYHLPCLEYITNDDADVGGTNFWTSLQELLMYDLPKLKGWWRLPDDGAENQVKLPSFPPCFSKLSIIYCPELSCMPLYPSVEDLTLWNSGWKTFEETALKAEEEALSSLRNLQFRCLPNLVTLPEGLQRATTLQSLKSLVIWDCDDFTAIPDWICNLSSLEKLDLWGCPNLKSLPASISSLTSLQTLEIEDCPTLSERCKRPTGEDWHKIQHIKIFYCR